MGKCLSTEKEITNSREEASGPVKDSGGTMKGEAQVGSRVGVVKPVVPKVVPSTGNRGSPRVSLKVSSNVATKGSPKGIKKNTDSPTPGKSLKVSSNVATKGSPKGIKKNTDSPTPGKSLKFSSNVTTKGSPKGVRNNIDSPTPGKRHVVSKTIQLKGNGSSGELPSFSQRFEINNHGLTTSGIRQQTTRVSSGGPSTVKVLVKDGTKQGPLSSSISSRRISRSGMGKTTTTTEKKTYTKDGKVFEDEIVTTVVEDDEGTKTTKKTTTRHLGDADSFDFSKVKKSLPEDKKSGKSRKSRSRSSSSSSDSDDGKKSKSKSEKSHSGGAKGLLGKLKSKAHRSHSSSDSDSSDDEDFAESAHKEINAIRKKHCVDKLKLNKEMCKYAKEWAVKMAKDEKMSHRPDGKYGENIFCITSNQKTFKVNSKEVVDKWYGESKEHKFGKEPEGTTLKTGHFTQMVWKDCKQMGVGKARSASGLKVFIVANFDPKGNWMGQFAKQVPPVGGLPKETKASKVKAKKDSSSSSSSSSDSSSDEEDFVEDVIKSHNDYRKKHGVQPLKKSKKLNKYAKEWAQTIAKKDKMEHRSSNEHGENIYCAWSSNPKHKIKGGEPVDSWYSEIKDFTYGKEPADLRAGHFTQVVWEDSKEIGVAMARSKSGKIYVVANYSPPGNFVGSFSTKVHKAK